MSKTIQKELIKGTYQAAGRGMGYLIPQGQRAKENDCFVPQGCAGGAWDGDEVEAQLTGWDPMRPDRPTAKVIRVITRSNKKVTGTVERQGRELWLRPDNDRLPPVKLSAGKLRARAGQKMAAAVTSFGTAHLPPLGAVKEDFGPAGSRRASVEAILYQKDICREFPPQALSQAQGAPQTVSEAELAGRLDLREKTVITIDGASSKDLDDAVSLEKDEKGNWVLGVHIADVSHYVPYGSALDQEAWTRGTSVYFADQVIPMLPVELSNGICSLNPGVDRLTLSCFVTLTAKGEPVGHELKESVIRSTERMTYGDCNTLLKGGDKALEERYAHILPMLRDMAKLARALQKRRFARGSLDLETQESYILCDDAGAPVDVVARGQGESEKIIEDFMLIANETVAEHLCKLQKPAVYRVHEKPSQEKVDALRAMLSPLGFSLKDGSSQSYQKAVDAFRDTPRAAAVSMMVLRSLMKARYAPENLGHFGLSAPYYCHFTSPIRRYPDLMVHRSVHALLEKDGKAEKVLQGACQRAAEQSSQRELAAQSAERDIDKLYFAEYMTAHLGETFAAAVSGVTRFGLFAALPSGVEGLIPVETLPEDRYVYDEVHLTLSGERTGREFTFGMPLDVVCVSADPGTGRVEFRLPGREEAPGREPGRSVKVPREPKAPKGKPRKGRGSRSAMHVPKGRKSGKRR